MPYKNPADAKRRDKEYREEARLAAEKHAEKIDKRLRRSPLLRKIQTAGSTTIMDPMPVPTKDLKIKVPKDGLRIAVIPDAQIRRGVPIDHIKHAGMYLARKQPDVIVCLSDWWDMPSLGTHD